MKDERRISFVWSRVLYRSALYAVFYPVSLILFQDIHLFSIKHCAKEQNTVNWQTRLTKWQDGTDKKEVRSPGRTSPPPLRQIDDGNKSLIFYP